VVRDREMRIWRIDNLRPMNLKNDWLALRSASSSFQAVCQEHRQGRHIAGQIMRSGTSPAPNYGEARGAESHADFVHKLGIVLKELNETSIWLRVIERSEIVKKELLMDIVAENRELCRIFTASLKTARSKR